MFRKAPESCFWQVLVKFTVHEINHQYKTFPLKGLRLAHLLPVSGIAPCANCD